jgi:2-keto-4-pentenoate hydratase/2-oxohepta-3-ene-1,7-dioic acid hydratase in catechol pathway
MRTLLRTTDGYFLRDGADIYLLGDIAADQLMDVLSTNNHGEPVAITGDLLAPAIPGQIFLVGINYPSHAEEVGMDIPNEPIIGLANGSAVVAPGSVVTLPAAASDFVDYEGELAVVVGRPLHNASEEEAAKAVLGYTACIDLSLRDVLIKAIMAMRNGDESPTLASAKDFPGAKPLGPELILLGGQDPSSLDVQLLTHVNGEQRQAARTSEMIFSIPRLLANASAIAPIKPGDVISTGTPAGIGMPEGIFLKPGDKVSVTVGALTSLEITVT